MAVVSFWSEDKGETGKTLGVIALATHMAIEHNYRILVISTSFNDDTLKTQINFLNFYNDKDYFQKVIYFNKNLHYICFNYIKGINFRNNLGLFGPNANLVMQNGVEGLNRFIRSNKVTPDIITNYTKIVFKERLEILLGYQGEERYYSEVKSAYPSIIELANQYYDLVIVDVNSKLDSEIQKEILHNSDLIVATMSQRLSSIKRFNEVQQNNQLLNSAKTLLLIGRYDRFSKYTTKNITRGLLKDKNEVNSIPYNTLFFEACEEAGVPDLFLKLRKISDENDRNFYFLKEIKRLEENIIYRLQDLQMRKR